jgi:formate-dependent nitrite reductase membrane component NrfD
MRLYEDWKRILRKAWSVRLALLSGFFDGCVLVVPFFVGSNVPVTYLAAAGLVSSIGAVTARVLRQKDFDE